MRTLQLGPNQRRRAHERGSASVELVLLTPVLILFLLLFLGFGRISHAKQLVDDAAAQAARAATLNYLDPGQAQAAATQTAAQALAAGGLSCNSDQVSVETGSDRPGGSITVQLACHADLSQAVAAGLPGAVTLTATATSPIDVYVPSARTYSFSEGALSPSGSGGDRS
jgi:Flp pilus assembly protein TadG